MATKTNSQRLIEARKRREEESKNSSSAGSTFRNSDKLRKTKLERTIGLDTFESDLSNTNTTLSSVLGGWQTQETLANTRSAVENMYKRTSDYQNYVSKYQPDAKTNVGEISSYYKQVLDNWDNIAGTYGQYKDADSYTKETAKLKELQGMTKDELASYLKGDNPIAYTTYGGQDITWKGLYDEKFQKEMANSKEGAEGWKKYLADKEVVPAETKKDKSFLETVAGYMGNITDTSLPAVALQQVVNDKRNDTSYMNPTDEWTDEERNIFGAYYLEDPDSAYEYATNLNNSKNRAKKDEKKQKIADSATSSGLAGTGHTLASIALAPTAMYDFLDDLTDSASGRPILEESFVTPFEYSQEVQGSIGSKLNEVSGTINENVPVLGGKGLGDLYGVGTSVAQSALSGYALGGLGTMVSYFGQGASAGIDEALSRGATDEQAMLYGVLVGAGEGVSEKIGVDNMFKLGSADTVKGFIKNVLKQAGSEGIEEGISSIISQMADDFVMQDKSVFNNAVRTYMTQGMSEEEAKQKAWGDAWNSVAWDAVAGAVSGGTHGLIQTAVQSGSENRMNKKVGSTIRENETVDDLKNLASELGGDAYQKYFDLIDSGKISDAKLGKLFNAVESDTISGYKSAEAETVMRSVANKANELGDSKNSGLIASAIQKKADGQKLSSEEKAVLKTDTAQTIMKYGARINTSSDFDNALKRVGQVDSIITPKTVEEKAVMSATKEAKAQAQETQTKVNEMVQAEGREDISFYSESMEQAKAEAFNKIYDGKTDLESYADSFELAYTYGKNKIGVSEALKNKGVLTEAQALKAYEAGNVGRAIEKQARVDAINQKYSGTAFVKGKFDDSILDYNGNAEGKVAWKDLGASRQNAIKFVRAFSEVTGVNVKLITSTVDENGKRIGENGRYEASTNTIYIDAYAGSMDASALNDAIIPTVSHEVTHWMKAKAPAMYQKMQDYVLETLTLDGKKTLNEMIAEEKARMKQAHPKQKVTDEDAIDELVARGTEDMLANSDKVRKMLAKMSKTEQDSFIAKVKETFENIMNWVNDLLKQYKSNSKEAELLRQYKERMKELSKMWDKTLEEAIQTNQSMQAEGIKNDIALLEENGVLANEENATVYSVRYLLDDEKKDKVASDLVSVLGVSKDDAMEYLTAETSIASLVLNPKHQEFLDYEADDNEVAIKNNSDYPQGTVDFSNICAKRRDFTSVMNRIMSKFKGHIFLSTDLAKIRTIMSEEKITIPCGICYVEDRRQLDSIVAEDFVKALELYRNGSKTRPDGKPFNANQLKALKMVENDTYTPSIYELITLEGRNALRDKDSNMENAWVTYNNARGMQSVRLLTNEAEYRREILKYSKADVKKKNDLGGLRIYSFSDAEIPHLIDLVQVITDSASKGLSIQGYTKVNWYAKMIRDTGVKLNRSLIPAGELGYHIENGKAVLDYDTVEGIDINDKDFFDSTDYDNVGNILIGINEVQIKSAMLDPFVDYIIPFHTGQSGDVLKEKGIDKWQNYKNSQSERNISDGKKSAKQINIYTDVIQKAEAEGNPIKDKVQFVEKFLSVCKENGLIPRFSEFLNTDENGDYIYTEGYHKFIIDFKTFHPITGEYLPQMPVKPIFDNAFITQTLMDFAKQEKGKQAELQPKMDKAIARIEEEVIRTQYSDRDSEGNQLTEAQAEFFKDSKVRDENGNLKVMYHGTEHAGFTVFDPQHSDDRISMFFTDILSVAKGYSGTKDTVIPKPTRTLSQLNQFIADNAPPYAKYYGVISRDGKYILRDTEYEDDIDEFYETDSLEDAYRKILELYGMDLYSANYKVYLNLQNPLVVDARNNNWDEIDIPRGLLKDLNEFWDNPDPYGYLNTATTRQFSEYAKESGYDGVIFNNIIDTAVYASGKERFTPSTVVIAFDSNQIKSVANENPTTDSDIRYSDRHVDEFLASLDADELLDLFWGDEETTSADTPKKQRAQRRVDEVKNRLDAIGLSFTGTKSLAFTDERIEQYLREFGASTPNYAQAYIAYMTPQQYLNLTMGSQTHTVDRIENESASYGEVDFEKLGESGVMYLSIHEGKSKAEVTGHEGRHRMLLLGKAGFERIPVLLFDYRTKYDKTAKDSLKLTTQRYNDEDFISKTRDTVVYDLVPLSSGNKDLIIQKFGSGVEADVHYSDRDYTSVYELMGEKDTLDEENRKLKADIEKLKATIGSEDVKITRFRSLADYLKKQAGSNYSREALGDALKNLYNYIQTTDDLKWYNVMAKAEEIANDMMQLNVPVNYFREVMTDIRQDKVSLSEDQYAEAVKLYGSYGNLHKALFGSINLTKSGKPLEEQWKDWAKAFPMVFKADISATDMVKELRDIVDALKSTSAVMGEYERQEAIRHLGMEIYNQFWNIASDTSEAVRKERVAHREMMEELRQTYQKRQAEKTLHPVGEVALKYEKLLKDTIKRDRAQMKRIRELGNKRMEEYKERAEKKATIQKITKNALTLNEWFVKNSKDKHIPEEMKGAVVQLISAIDFSSKQMLGIGGAEERRGQPTGNDLRLAKALSKLYKVSGEMKDNQTEESVFMELDIPDSAVKLLKDLSTESLVLNQMTLDQLQALDVIVSTFKSAIIKANKNFVLAQNETRERTSNALIHDVDSLKEKKADNLATNFLEYANTTPYYMLKRLGRVGEQIFNVLMDAQEQLVFLEEEIINFVKKTVDGKKIKQWSEEIHEIKILDGKRSTEDNPKYKTIKMTTAQIMSLYALEKRESAKLHLAGGGIRIANIKDGLKTIKDMEGSSLAKSELHSIIGRLTNEQKRVADALQKYMSETGAEWGNKVTMARWDIKQFGEENYFPMATIAQDKNLDDVGKKDNSIYRLLNMSFTKELTPRSNNQLIIDNIFDVFSEHMTDMAKYTTHALPLLDTMKILGYSRKDFYVDENGKKSVRHDTISVASSIRRAFGDNGYRYIINLLKDLNGVEVTPRDEALTKTLMSNYKISAVGGNLRVALLQGSAFIKAGLVMNPKYLTKALATNGLKGIEKAMKHSGIALWKSKGHYDLNIGRSVASEIKQDKNWMDTVRDWSLKGAEWGDKITWGYLWNACELWARENTPYSYNSADFNKAVADKLREIIVKTQVVDSTLTRSQMMRGKSAMVQTLTAFMSESTMTYNMLSDAFFEWSLDARKEGHSYKSTFSKHGRKFATTASVFALTAFTTALAGGFVDAVRDDEEDEKFDEKYLQHFLGALGDNLNPIVNLPIIKDIVSIAQGYSPSRFDEQSFVNLFSGMRQWMKVAEGEGNVYKATYKTLQGMSQLTGLPVSNMMRDVVSMWNSTIGEMYPHLRIEQ